MSRGEMIFEVRVKVRNGAKHYSSFLGMFVEEEVIKMFHIPARTVQQAGKKARKYGRPISVRKPNVEKMYGSPEKLRLDQEPLAGVYQFGSPYESTIAMDEMIWQKKKREKRIKNRKKDKKKG